MFCWLEGAAAAAPAGRHSVPPFLVVALGAIGAAALVKILSAEARRVNEALDRRRAAESGELKTVRLQRDPVTGDYRPERN